MDVYSYFFYKNTFLTHINTIMYKKIKDLYKKNKRILNIFIKKIKKDNISEFAAECAYFTILSIIPFGLIFFTFVKFTNIEIENIYYFLEEFFSKANKNVIYKLISEGYFNSLEKISILTIIFSLWSAGKGFFSLIKGFRKIYGIDIEKKSILIRIEGSIYTLIFILTIIFFLLIIVFGNKIFELISNKYRYLSTIILYLIEIRWLIIILLMFILFLMVYHFIPKQKTKKGSQKYGAIFSSILWYLTSYVFSIYIERNNLATYESFNSIVLIMMWFYATMYIILIGAEINFFIYKTKKT